MRISDWSSDVCSSVYDVPVEPTGRECRAPHRRRGEAVGDRQLMSSLLIEDRDHVRILTLSRPQRRNAIDQALSEALSDRQSVGEGKSVAVRVDLGGRRSIKKQKTRKKESARAK